MVQEQLREQARCGQGRSFDFRLRRADGSSTWVRAVINSVSTEEYEAIALQGLLIDVQEQKQVEQALRTSQKKFASVFHNCPDVIVLADADIPAAAEAAAVGTPHFYEMNPEEARENRRKAYVHSDKRETFSIPGRGEHDVWHPIRFAKWTPSKEKWPDGPRGIYLLFHGGGWVFGDACGQNDVRLEEMSEELGLIVLVPDYSKAPEHPYPAAVNECELAAIWVEENAEKEFGEKAAKMMIIGGESAGHGNLVYISGKTDKDNGLTRATEALQLRMVRAEKEERRLGLRGIDENHWVPRNAEIAWQGFDKPQEEEYDEPEEGYTGGKTSFRKGAIYDPAADEWTYPEPEERPAPMREPALMKADDGNRYSRRDAKRAARKGKKKGKR